MVMKLRLLFDAYWWGTGPGANRTVQREFINAWVKEFPQDELVLAVRRGTNTSDVPEGVEIAHTRLWPHALANRWELPRIAQRCSSDVTVAHNYAPWRGRSAVFIHDAMFVDHPEWFSRAERLYFSRMLPWARRASLVVTSTETEAARLTRLEPRLAPVHAIGLSVPTALSARSPRRPESAPDGEFALTVGRLNVRKNLAHIIEAAGQSAKVTSHQPLCIVGSTAHSGVGMHLTDSSRALVEAGTVRFLGGLPDDELAWLYKNASVTITLSLDEGFGMPAIEAAWFGSPLLASDIAVFRETVGDYARFVPPLAPPEQVAAVLDQMWGEKPVASAQSRIADSFRWSRAVERLRTAIVG